tara:strand:- start:403 stop:984 length:582 start_codon:yes stop_codon:yes gene_type:complete
MIFGKPQFVLKAKNVELRTPRYNDYEQWLDLRESSKEFLEIWEPKRGNEFFKRNAFNNRVKWAKKSAKADQAYQFFIFDKSETLLGSITVENIRKGPSDAATLGYWLGKQHTGKGFMREAVLNIIDFSFTRLTISRLEAATLPENKSSRRLLEKVGFKYEGVGQSYLQINGRWRNHVLYGLLRNDRRGHVEET